MVQRYVIVLTIIGLVDAISYMLVTPSIVFYVLQNGGNKDIYGIIMSAFSFASFCTKPLIGWWSDSKGFRIPYIVSICTALVGGIVYVSASALPNGSPAVYTILLARLLSGCGAANSTLGYAYVARSVPVAEQTQTTALLSLCRILGMAVGPGLNILVSKVDLHITDTWKLDNLNSVGLVLVAANFISLLAITFLLEEPKKHIQADEEKDGETFNNDEELDAKIAAASSNFGKSQSSDTSTIEIIRSFLSVDILVPMLSIFTFNANFQLIETGFAPASHDALGWGPVQSSLALGSISFIIAANMANVINLSKRGYPDVNLLCGGLVMSIIAYTVLYFSWVKDSTPWHFVLPILVAGSSFPYLAPATRSIFTLAVQSKPALEQYNGFMQAILSMAASVAGFTAPSFVAKYALRSPEEVFASSDGRELTIYSLFAPIMSILVLIGIIYSRVTGAIADAADDFTREDDDFVDPTDEFTREDDVFVDPTDSSYFSTRSSVGERSSLIAPRAPKKKSRRSSTILTMSDSSTRSIRQRRSSNIGIMLETSLEGLLDESIR